MTDISATEAAAPALSIDTVRPRHKMVLPEVLRHLAKSSGRSLGSILGDHVKTAFGPGKLNFEEYTALALYDLKRYSGADLNAFVGARLTHEIFMRVNFRIELYDLMRNKISLTAILEAHGFPCIPIRAVFTTATGFPSKKCLNSVDALRNFLTDPRNYPLFGKPEQGFQSLGSASLTRFDATTKAIVGHDGRMIPLDAYMNDVVSEYSTGYLFQPRIPPHAETLALCGDRLATVRVLTLMTPDGPRIWRACEKIPGGMNAADNFWRQGNILVELDLESGERHSAITGVGPEMRELTHHPDSGGEICGTTVPNWQKVRRIALEGSRFFKDTALIGWDIAPVDDGAVIVEANVTPDLFLPQLADRRGVLDSAFKKFLQDRDRMATNWKRSIRKEYLESLRPAV